MKYFYQRLPLYQKQKDIIDCESRFTITEGSAQCGKTESHLIWIFEKALHYKPGDVAWWVEPNYDMARSLGYLRLKRLIQNKEIFECNESTLTIKLFNGGIIRFKSGDRPDSLYGETCKDICLDEYSRMTEEVFNACYSRLIQTGGNMKLIGNVKGINNWGYKLARKAESQEIPDWKYFKITAKDALEAGVLKDEMISQAEQTMPRGIFLELFYGIPFENASNKFFYSFDEKKHVGNCNINTVYPVYLSFDFNYNPICCALFQYYDNTLYCLEVIKLENSNIYSLCQVIKTKLAGAMVLVTGDATGSSHSAMVKDNLNYYKIIKSELNLGSSQLKVPNNNPKFEENQVLCNAFLEHHAMQIDPDKSSALIFDLKFVQIDNNGKIVKTDRSDPTQQADASDCFRYYLNTFQRHILKENYSLNIENYAA